jgi:hypothetical protein
VLRLGRTYLAVIGTRKSPPVISLGSSSIRMASSAGEMSRSEPSVRSWQRSASSALDQTQNDRKRRRMEDYWSAAEWQYGDFV